MAGLVVEDLKAIHADGTPDPVWAVTAQTQLDLAPHKLKWSLLEKPPKKCVLGVGTHGKVWRAVDPRTGQKFAVKNLRQRAAQREIEVFERLRAAPHPFVVQLFIVQNFDEAAACCLVMDACTGGDLMKKTKALREAATKGGTPFVAPERAQLWIAEIFLGLEYLHTCMDTLFRDLKPGNVLIDEGDNVKLADFGVSRLGTVSAGAWTFGGPTGSPAYIAPEILKQAPTDFKADIFSFGVLVWVVLTGGLSIFPEPQPPSNVRNMQGGNFTTLYDDWKLFQDAVKDESGEQAPPVTGPAQDFILQLTGETAAERLDHAAVRAHPYLSPLELPAVSSAAVVEWLAKVSPA